MLCRQTADVVRKQAEVGIDIVSDGEYGKPSWSNYILKRISGFEIRPDQLRPVIWLGRDRERFADAIFQDFPGWPAGPSRRRVSGRSTTWTMPRSIGQLRISKRH